MLRQQPVNNWILRAFPGDNKYTSTALHFLKNDREIFELTSLKINSRKSKWEILELVFLEFLEAL
jgi:hypothetical protein